MVLNVFESNLQEMCQSYARISAWAELPSIYSAVRSIGSKLEPHKEPTGVIVVDHVEKVPIEN
jgi:uncharacterized protein (TIGR03435 family)